MENLELAREIVNRLNKLCLDPEIKTCIHRIVKSRVDPSDAVINHPTIQVRSDGVGMVGVLNGIVGLLPSNQCIVARWTDSTRSIFVGFEVSVVD